VQLQLLKSKLHQACITHSDLYYEGSLQVDQDLLDAAGILPYERILVVNITNGERLETYAISGPRGSHIIRLNGAAARRGAVGDRLTIMSFGSFDPAEAAKHTPRVMILNGKNEIVVRKGGGES
jgi:aspartate 1-decarboxylase